LVDSMSPPLAHRLLGHPLAFCIVAPLLHLIALLGLLAALPSARSALVTYALLLVLPAALHLATRGPTVWIYNEVGVDVAADVVQCSSFLREARNLDQYEQKVSGCSVTNPTPTGCYFTLWGWWFGLPWMKTFKMTFTSDGGFHSTLDDGTPKWLPRSLAFRGHGGFTITDRGAGSARVLHYEKYGWPIVFPLIAFPLGQLWRHWHLRGMEVEMGVIRAQIEGITSKGPDATMLAKDHFGQKWTCWKYGAHHYLQERASAAMCRSQLLQHPAASLSEASEMCAGLRRKSKVGSQPRRDSTPSPKISPMPRARRA